ncbi:MAG: hypothetical protein K9N52_03485 [Verrucomicrobia bacterium]|nr:hypothetical protein [Verrucomicrobiota bacterium]
MGLGHEKLDVYRLSIGYVAWVYEKTDSLTGVHRPARGQWLRDLREYRWSSFRAYAGYEKGPEWMERHGDPGKWIVMAMARRYCGMTLGEVDEAMGRRNYASVGLGIKLLENRLRRDRRLRKSIEELDE